MEHKGVCRVCCIAMSDEKKERRSKIIETLWLFWAFHFVGFVNGIIGPTLLDLQLKVGASLSQMTYIFFVQGAGFIAGILLACVTERCMSTRLILTYSLLIGCVANFALPWGVHFYYLAIMFFVLGLAKGMVDYAALSICNQLWQENKSVSLQFITLGAGTAAFLAPFIATPFLADPHDRHSFIAARLRNYILPTQTCHDALCTNEVSHVQYAYVILGLICLPAVVAFSHFHRERAASPLITYEQFTEVTRSSNYTGRERFFLLLLFLFHVPVFGILLTYSDLLTPFGVDIDLHLAKTHMTTMTSTFWGCFLAGRVLNLLFSNCLPSIVLLGLNFAGWIASCIVLVVLAEKQEVALWMGTAALGVFSSAYLPLVLAWSNEHMKLSGGMITASLVASGLGEILVPFITGQCFSSYGPRSLIYSVCSSVAYEVFVFLLLVICGRQMRT